MLQKMNTIDTIESFIPCHGKQPTARCDATHDGQMITSLEHSQDRRLSARCIGFDSRWQEVKARFIHKNKDSMFQTRFFFISLQTCLRQSAMASSFRCVARSMGCCGVHFSSLSKRATCDL